MSVKIHITKKGKIWMLAVLMLILAGSGGYLLWRVNQDDTVAPTDSEAGQSYNGICNYCHICNATQATGKPTCTLRADGLYDCPNDDCCNSSTITCGDNAVIRKNPNISRTDAKFCTNCNHSAPESNVVVGDVQCNVGSQCTKKCYWPEVAYCNGDGTCSCKSGSSNGCTDTEPQCTPTCASECSARCGGCDNLYYVAKLNCDTNTCDSGAWVTKPTGTYAYCDNIAYSATATDSDGIDETSISVKLNTVSRVNVAKNTSGTSTTISETLSSATNCLAPGSYTLAMDWKDTKAATSTNCALSTTFTVSEEVLNPDWEFTKGVVEKCIDENTENPTSQLTYTITLRNIGAGVGTITKIVDALDSKILQTYISNISDSGAYSEGDITWTLADQTFDSQESRTYTYTVTIPKDQFGTYTNVVTAYPSTGENLIAHAEVLADCMIDVPDTGLLDSTTAKITLGVIFILFGLNFNRVMNLTKKLSISMNDISDERRKKNFEKKVVKR